MCTMSVGICTTTSWQSWNNIIICHFTKRGLGATDHIKSRWIQMSKSLISHFSYTYWTLNLRGEFDTGALGSGEWKSTQCQSNHQSTKQSGAGFSAGAHADLLKLPAVWHGGHHLGQLLFLTLQHPVHVFWWYLLYERQREMVKTGEV